MSHVPGRLGSESLPRHGAPLPEVIEPVPEDGATNEAGWHWRRRRSNHSPLEGESQKPSRQATADAVGGQPTPGYPASSTSIQASGLCSFQCLSGVGAFHFPPPARLRAAPWSCRLPLKGGVIRLVMFENGFGGAFRLLGVEAEARPPRRLPAVAAPNQPREDGHEDSSYPISNTDTDIHAIPLPVCPTPLASQICRTPQPSPLVATTS